MVVLDMQANARRKEEKKKKEHTNLCIIVLYFMRFNLWPVISVVQA